MPIAPPDSPRGFSPPPAPPPKAGASAKGIALAFVCVVVLAVGARAIARALSKPSVSDLVTFTPTSGSFRAKFPGTPTRKESSTKETTVTVYEVEGGRWSFAAMHFDLPEGRTLEGAEYEALQGAITNGLGGISGKPSGAPRQFLFDEQHAAIRQDLESPRVGKGTVLAVLREDRRIYILICCGKSYDPVVGEAFIESFELTDWE